MGDTILTHDMIADRLLWKYKNSLKMAANSYKGYSAELHAVGRYTKGSSLTIHLPNRARATEGAAINIVDSNELETTVTVDNHYHCAFDFTTLQMTMDIEDFATKYLDDKVIALANQADAHGCEEYVNLYNHVGTPGIVPATFAPIVAAGTVLTNEAVLQNNRVGIITPGTYGAMSDGELKGIFNESMVAQLLREGFLGTWFRFDHFMDQNISSHTVGTYGAALGAPDMNGVTAENATTLVTDGWNAGDILNIGDIVTANGVYAVNPVSGIAWEGNQLRKFVATAQAMADGGGNMTIPIYPTIRSSAAAAKDLPYQTVGTVPANDAAITVVSGDSAQVYAQNLYFNKDCFAFTMVPFEEPRSAGQAVMYTRASDADAGVSIAFATGYDISNYTEITRADILYGWDTIRPPLGVRMVGN